MRFVESDANEERLVAILLPGGGPLRQRASHPLEPCRHLLQHAIEPMLDGAVAKLPTNSPRQPDFWFVALRLEEVIE